MVGYLEKLDLGGCNRITVSGLSLIIKFNRFLKELDLRGLRINSEFLCNNLVYLKDLRNLTLFGMKHIREDDVTTFQEHRKRLAAEGVCNSGPTYALCHISASYL